VERGEHFETTTFVSEFALLSIPPPFLLSRALQVRACAVFFVVRCLIFICHSICFTHRVVLLLNLEISSPGRLVSHHHSSYKFFLLTTVNCPIAKTISRLSHIDSLRCFFHRVISPNTSNLTSPPIPIFLNPPISPLLAIFIHPYRRFSASRVIFLT